MRNTLSHLILMIEIFVSFLTFCVNSLNKFSTIPRFCPLCVRFAYFVAYSFNFLDSFVINFFCDTEVNAISTVNVQYIHFQRLSPLFLATIGRVFCVLLLIFDILLAAPKWGSCLLIFVCVIISIVIFFIVEIGGPFPLNVADIVHGEFAFFVDFTVAITYNRCIGEFFHDCFK